MKGIILATWFFGAIAIVGCAEKSEIQLKITGDHRPIVGALVYWNGGQYLKYGAVAINSETKSQEVITAATSILKYDALPNESASVDIFKPEAINDSGVIWAESIVIHLHDVRELRGITGHAGKSSFTSEFITDSSTTTP